MYVLDMKEKSVRNKMFISAIQNFAQNEFALRYWPSMRLKMNRGEYIPLYEKDIKLMKMEFDWRSSKPSIKKF